MHGVMAPHPGRITGRHRLRRRPPHHRADELNAAFREEATGSRYTDILAVTDEPLVSFDIVGEPHAAIIDLTLTQVIDATW
jgi:glyceraldehyde-3-phosphate dehydrogenase/erythrose-4-phosphate dehydrogenase